MVKHLSRRQFVQAGVVAGAGLAAAAQTRAAGSEAPAPALPPSAPATFALETYAARSVNHLQRLVDADGLPYFNVFWTEPAEAAHDWPCLGDVMPRQLEAAIMLRRMTGRKVATEKRWLSLLFAHLLAGAADDVEIAGNTVRDGSISVHIRGAGTSRNVKVHDNTIEKGTFVKPHLWGIELAGTRRLDGAEIRGNKLVMGSILVAAPEGSDITVRGNRFTGGGEGRVVADDLSWIGENPGLAPEKRVPPQDKKK